MQTVIYDIETEPKSAQELEALMPAEIRDPYMPDELREFNVKPEDFNHASMKDPSKIEEWRAEKMRKAHADHKEKISKWQDKCLQDKLKWIEKAALSAGTCIIRLIGLSFEDGAIIIMVNDAKAFSEAESDLIRRMEGVIAIRFNTEAEMLEQFWKNVDNTRQPDDEIFGEDEARFAGFHSNRFDLPMLRRKSWNHGVRVTAPIMSGNYIDRKLWVDLHEEWQSGDRETRDSLNTVAKALGVEQKNGSGEYFYKLYARDRIAALEYLVQDLKATRAVAAKMGF